VASAIGAKWRCGPTLRVKLKLIKLEVKLHFMIGSK
jgi:hypothetical protein